MNLVVQKYGGSSVADSEKIKNIAGRISEKINSGVKVIAVVSAMGKTTDNLIKLAKGLSDLPSPREMDLLLSTGEQVSASLLSIALSEIKIKSISLTGYQAGILTTEDFSEAKIKKFNNEKILSLLEVYNAIVITGFQGINENGDITTLGRGGSDTSAVALAASLNVNCEIYSDVPGIFTVDPKLHPNARKLNYISYDEMLEMSSLGSKVLHNRSVEIAKKFKIKIYCASSFTKERGSYVVDKTEIIEKPVVTGLSITENETQVTLKNLPVNFSLIKIIFENIASANLNVDMISIINYEETLAVSFTIIQEKKNELEITLKEVLQKLDGWQIEYQYNNIKLSVVGIGMKSSVGVASRFFKALENIPIKLVTTSEIKISCLIEKEFKEEAVSAVVKEFSL